MFQINPNLKISSHRLNMSLLWTGSTSLDTDTVDPWDLKHLIFSNLFTPEIQKYQNNEGFQVGQSEHEGN